MRYIFFVSREPWASFNSIYAYARLKKEKPSEMVALYSSEENMSRVCKMLQILYDNLGWELKIKKIKIGDSNIEALRKIMMNIISEGDIVDITGARKLMILSLLGIRGIRVIYLHLQDMRFSSRPFMMRPLNLQELMEVNL